MAAKLFMSDSTAAAVATVTVYTVPADKAARVRVLYEMEGPANTVGWSVRIGTPTNQTTIHKGTATNNDALSGSNYVSSPNPTLSILADALGSQEGPNLLYLADVDNAGYDIWAAPLPADYFLSTGDTVRFKVGSNAATNLLFQVGGVEDDA